MNQPTSDNRHWLVRPETIRRLWQGLIAVLALTLVAELFVHPHQPFTIANLFSFHALYGFLACVAMVLVAKGLGLLLKRPEDYYATDQAPSANDAGDRPHD